MNIEDLIERCEAEVRQIKKYEPDPYYVSYFFRSYLSLVEKIYCGIFEEADRDFGLFASQYSKEKFKEKSILKNDSGALEFVSWYEEKVEGEHVDYYPRFMHSIAGFYSFNKRLPEIKIMIRAKDRYKNDMFHAVPVRLSGGRLSSKEELQIEVNRHIPVFLEVINHKRTENGEPTVSRDDVVASSFFESFESFEISYAAEVYIQVVRRIVADSREKIRELTAWGQ